MADYPSLPKQRFQGIGFTSQRTRNRMVERLEMAGIQHPLLLETLRQLPRHLFVDEALAHRAYEDTALPIGLGQTLSQPYIVARMTELLLETRPQKVLEIGTGSGFQCALLACLVPQVFTIERLEPLYLKARQRFQELQLTRVEQRLGDGYAGWPEEAPFDAILVTAAPKEIPQSLLNQLAEGGRMLLPVGDQQQHLHLIDKRDGRLLRRIIEPVYFVPLLPGS